MSYFYELGGPDPKMYHLVSGLSSSPTMLTPEAPGTLNRWLLQSLPPSLCPCCSLLLEYTVLSLPQSCAWFSFRS